MNEPQDFIGLIIALMAAITSKEIAHLVGPYAAIFVLAVAGSGLALSSNERVMTARQSILYVGIRVVIAIALTVSLAELFQKVAAWMQPRYTISPIAFIIGWIKDYSAIRDALMEFIKSKVRG